MTQKVMCAAHVRNTRAKSPIDLEEEVVRARSEKAGDGGKNPGICSGSDSDRAADMDMRLRVDHEITVTEMIPKDRRNRIFRSSHVKHERRKNGFAYHERSMWQ